MTKHEKQLWAEFLATGKTLAPPTTQADRANIGKMRWTLMDFESMKDMIAVLEFGAKKYSKDNWKKGLPVTEITDSMLRHLVAFLAGENIDPESGLPHTGHIMCNAMFLSHMYKFKPEFDDRVISKKEAESPVQS